MRSWAADAARAFALASVLVLAVLLVLALAVVLVLALAVLLVLLFALVLLLACACSVVIAFAWTRADPRPMLRHAAARLVRAAVGHARPALESTKHAGAALSDAAVLGVAVLLSVDLAVRRAARRMGPRTSTLLAVGAARALAFRDVAAPVLHRLAARLAGRGRAALARSVAHARHGRVRAASAARAFALASALMLVLALVLVRALLRSRASPLVAVALASARDVAGPLLHRRAIVAVALASAHDVAGPLLRRRALPLIRRGRMAVAKVAASATHAAAVVAPHLRSVVARVPAVASVAFASADVSAVRRAASRIAARPGRMLAMATTLGLVLALGLSVSGLLVPASQRSALGASITVSLISGEASVVRSGGAVELVSDGAVLHAGETVRTGLGTRLVLTYFEGSTVEVEPSSELTIDEAAFGDGGATVIRMTQLAGHTWHVVTKLLQSGSRYEVRTPTSTATVRGTEFEVDVAESGDTRVSTTAGAVATTDTSGMVEVVVTAGLETTVKMGETPAPPAPMPEPLRKVSVQLDSVNSTVVDSLGRVNGMKDGKLVLQTPGAKIERSAAGLIVILPNPPEGRIVVIGRDAPDVQVVTTVQSRGADPVRTETTVKRSTSSGPSSAALVATIPVAPASAVRPATTSGGSSSAAPASAVTTTVSAAPASSSTTAMSGSDTVAGTPTIGATTTITTSGPAGASTPGASVPTTMTVAPTTTTTTTRQPSQTIDAGATETTARVSDRGPGSTIAGRAGGAVVPSTSSGDGRFASGTVATSDSRKSSDATTVVAPSDSAVKIIAAPSTGQGARGSQGSQSSESAPIVRASTTTAVGDGVVSAPETTIAFPVVGAPDTSVAVVRAPETTAGAGAAGAGAITETVTATTTTTTRGGETAKAGEQARTGGDGAQQRQGQGKFVEAVARVVDRAISGVRDLERTLFERHAPESPERARPERGRADRQRGRGRDD